VISLEKVLFMRIFILIQVLHLYELLIRLTHVVEVLLYSFHVIFIHHVSTALMHFEDHEEKSYTDEDDGSVDEESPVSIRHEGNGSAEEETD
jgi:hypothetical protein